MPNRSRLEAAARPGRLAFAAPVAVQAQAAGEARRRFRMAAYTGEPLSLFGFDCPVVIDCATLDLTAQRIPALLDHMSYPSYPGGIVGQIERIAVEGPNNQPPVVAEGYFTPTGDPSDAAAFVLAKADAGFVWQASVGGDAARYERVEAGQTAAVNGRTYPGPVIVARGSVLREISFVVLGADRRTSAVLARIKGAAMSFEEWLLSMGFEDPASLSEVQRANLQQVYNTEHPEEGGDDVAAAEGEEPVPEEPVAAAEGEETPVEEPPTNAAATPPAIQASGDPVADYRRRIAAEERRVADVRRICAGANNPEITVTAGGRRRQVSLQAHAIEQGWTSQRTELEALRAARGAGPAVISRSHDRDCTLQALEGALILRAGGRLDHPVYNTPRAAGLTANGRPKISPWLRAGLNDAQRNRIMDNAHRYADMSAVDLCREAVRLDGGSAPHGRAQVIQAAVSGMSLSNVFTTSVNAILLSTYAEAPDTTQGWTREQDVADYRLQERPRMLKGPNLAKRPRGGTADHLTRSDGGETYKIASYAGQIEIDEQDFVDDNLSALSDLPVEMGMAAARLRPDLVYAIILDNPTLTTTAREMFNTTDGNKIGSAALAADKLRTAVSTMLLFQENDVNLNLAPTHLLVPPSLRHLAYELVNSSEILIAGTAGSVTERGSSNALRADGLQPVSDARLENGVTDPDSGTAFSGSASTWYLVSALAHTIEIGYLRGTGRSPRVRSWKHTGEGKYGMGWDVEMSIGAVPLDWKGFVYNQSAAL